MSLRPWSVAPVTVVVLSSLALCALAVGPAPARGQARGQSSDAGATERPWPPVATFSILGFDSATGEVGVAVQSRVFSVGNGVIWGEAGVGVVATQAIVDVSYGPQALELLRQGLSPAQVVERVLENDPDPRPDRWTKEGRQFSVMNARGEVATHTGPGASEWAGHRIGRHASAQGNILAGPEVVDEMIRGFEETDGHLSLRLLAALEHGQAAGGDRRGMQSAAMLIVKEDGGVWLNNDVVLRLHVDDHVEPIQELRRLVEMAAARRERRRERRPERRPGQELHIGLANGSDRERATADALRRIVDEYDVERWIVTDSILVDENSIPHSHPVLTIHTRHLGDDRGLLSTFLHEQFHWLERPDQGFRDAMVAFEEIWPEAPGGPPEGARDRESTYRHLVVCDLEFQAMAELVGQEAARAIMESITHYTWIYATVLNDPRVREVNTQHGMVVSRDFSATYR